MILDCKHCGPMSEIAPMRSVKKNGEGFDYEICCVTCGQSVVAESKGKASHEWNIKQSPKDSVTIGTLQAGEQLSIEKVNQMIAQFFSVGLDVHEDSVKPTLEVGVKDAS